MGARADTPGQHVAGRSCLGCLSSWRIPSLFFRWSWWLQVLAFAVLCVCVCVGVCVSLRPGLLRFASLCCRSPRLCALFWRSSDGPSTPSRLLASLVLTVHHTTRLGFYRDNRPSKS